MKFGTTVALLSLVIILLSILVWTRTTGEKISDFFPGGLDEKEVVETTNDVDSLYVVETPKEKDVSLPNPDLNTDKGRPEKPIIAEGLSEYIKVIDGCGVHFGGECLNVRSGPGVDFPSVAKLRNNIVLKVGEKVETEDGDWYKIIFDEYLRYPERVKGEWYVAAAYVESLLAEDAKDIWEIEGATSTKLIVVDLSEQTITAFDQEEVFMTEKISSGLKSSPTPRGTFTVFRKTPTRYMQGPLPGKTDYYDLPGVPWNLYFTEGGAVIHGAYWHESFGSTYSHGCVNLEPDIASKLYSWAELGTTVIVKD